MELFLALVAIVGIVVDVRLSVLALAFIHLLKYLT